MVVTNSTFAQIEQVFSSHGCDPWGWVPLEKPLTMNIYTQWLEKGLHGDMDYLATHKELKENPLELRPRVRSSFVVLEPYLPHPWPRSRGPKAGVALYAQGEDYHIHLKIRLQKLVSDLKEKFPGEDFYVFTDSAPIMERDLAYRASLGWFGKNTCLLNRTQGSLFFIAEIFTSLECQKKELPASHDFCGTCTRCIEVCPTSALNHDRQLDATRCISYWTIESSEVASEELRSQFGGWIFGCDLCQTVCPWNLKLHGESLRQEPSREDYIEDLGWVLRTTSKQLQKQLKGTPLARAAGLKLKRNAIVAAANQGLTELLGEVELYVDHEKLGDVAKWAVRVLSQPMES